MKTRAPKVSVVSITYNQEKYIRQTLDSFVEQKTDFEIEVIIADDCSTDDTPKIIREYAKQFPDIFRPILRKKNIGIQKNCIDAFKQTTGRYVAFCEGDDFWTDSTKLQKQADFLDFNSEYSVCFHPVKIFFENNEQQDSIYPLETDSTKFTTTELLKNNYIQSNSVMYRRQDYDSLPDNVMPLDWYLHLYHAQFGKIGFINSTMSAYRRHSGGVWWDSHDNKQRFWKKHALNHLNMYEEVKKIYGKNENHKKIINNHIFEVFDALSGLQDRGDLLLQAEKDLPKATESYIVRLYQDLQSTKKELQKLDIDLHQTKQSLKKIELDLYHREKEIGEIKASKLWRLRNSFGKLKGK